MTDRIQRFEHAHGVVADLPLDKLAQLSNKELRKRIDGVIARCRSVDRDRRRR